MALEGFLEAAPDAIVVVDRTGSIVIVNQLAERLFGYSRQELLGMQIEGLVPRGSESSMLATAIESDGTASCHVTSKTAWLLLRLPLNVR